MYRTKLSDGVLGGQMDHVELTVRAMLAEHGRLAVPAEKLAAHDDLYAAGLTSLASVNVMLALEDAFGVELPDRLLQRATFGSVAAISAAIVAVRAGGAAGSGSAADGIPVGW